jgi:hypothetical protein
MCGATRAVSRNDSTRITLSHGSSQILGTSMLSIVYRVMAVSEVDGGRKEEGRKEGV